MSELSDRVKVSIKKVLFKKNLYLEVFGGDAGEAVLADLLKFCGEGMDPHVPGDPYSTANNVGKQQIANRIIRTMHMPADTVRRLVEQQEAAITADDD